MQIAAVVTLVGNSESFQSERQHNVVCKILTPARVAGLFLFWTLVWLCFSNFSTVKGADSPTAENQTTWKFSLDAKMDAQSRNFNEICKLEKWKADKLSRHQMLEARSYTDERLLFVRLRFHTDDGSVDLPKLSHFQFGYGDIFPSNTIVTTSSNGAGWEQPNAAYIKYCRDF